MYLKKEKKIKKKKRKKIFFLGANIFAKEIVSKDKSKHNSNAKKLLTTMRRVLQKIICSFLCRILISMLQGTFLQTYWFVELSVR